jgi:hypothetical protein
MILVVLSGGGNGVEPLMPETVAVTIKSPSVCPVTKTPLASMVSPVACQVIGSMASSHCC